MPTEEKIQTFFNIASKAGNTSINFDDKINMFTEDFNKPGRTQSMFLKAPSIAALKECLELVKGKCAIVNNTIRTFRYGHLYHVKYGDPIYMVIIPTETISINGFKFKVFRLLKHNGELSEVYLYVNTYCYGLISNFGFEIIEKMD
jgi:hypothetical protein